MMNKLSVLSLRFLYFKIVQQRISNFCWSNELALHYLLYVKLALIQLNVAMIVLRLRNSKFVGHLALLYREMGGTVLTAFCKNKQKTSRLHLITRPRCS